MRSPITQNIKIQKQNRFWLGPLVAGGFITLGYGLTHRILILSGNWQKPESEAFNHHLSFPGESLNELRKRHDFNGSIIKSRFFLQKASKVQGEKRQNQLKLIPNEEPILKRQPFGLVKPEDSIEKALTKNHIKAIDRLFRTLRKP